MFAASETLVSDVNSRRGAKAGGGGPGGRAKEVYNSNTILSA